MKKILNEEKWYYLHFSSFNICRSIFSINFSKILLVLMHHFVGVTAV